jgi:hypothetical protein
MRVVHGARGFCNINIEAVMVEYLRTAYPLGRIAIIDTDCHHGDGTQDIYWHDPDVLFISLHQDGRTLYPGSGFPNELGGANAAGTTLNIPLPPNTSEEGFLHIVDHVIAPIIDAFKPDLIVNSAGQDNHFSDPITNMNFSAQGYADLTARLRPHIAVLEGGYSIEGALPYVNVGILLAMAGLDYGNVLEPGYDPDAVRQTAAVSRMIHKTGELVLGLWEQRNRIREERCAAGGFEDRSRRIFYDTDGIHEIQKERLRICAECGGALRIDSRSDRGRHILAVHLPLRACRECREQGYRWYDAAAVKEYDGIYLQDRPADAYHARK